MKLQLTIQNGSKIYFPTVEEGLTWETDRAGSPGQLTFSVLKDGIINFQEGNNVQCKVDDQEMFNGFVFIKKRNKSGVIDVTAYDQLRYFKNKDTYVYQNKTATEFIKMLAGDFKLQTGVLEDTKYKIASQIEENSTLFDMVQNALDLTLQNKKGMYVLYDDFGKLTLKNIANMIVNVLINDQSAEDFDYQSSIDDTYNKVKLTYENSKTGKRDVYIAQSGQNINNWGVLQYFDKLKKGENGKEKADTLLSLFNQKTRKLSISNVFGDMRVRAGCMIPVCLNLGDINTQNLMLVEKCKHTFKNDQHLMDLTLRGGEFVG